MPNETSNWKIYLVIFILAVFTGGIIGWWGHGLFNPKPVENVVSSETTDTVWVYKVAKLDTTILVTQEPKVEVLFDTLSEAEDSNRLTRTVTTYTDTLKRSTDSLDIEIAHTIIDTSDTKGYVSVWNPLDIVIKGIQETVYIDSVRTVTELKYVANPYYLDMWFWALIVQSIAFIGLIIGIIIS